MSVSPRPVQRMAAAFFSIDRPAGTAAAALQRPLPGATARRAVWRARILPLALAAVVLPVHAAPHRAAARPGVTGSAAHTGAAQTPAARTPATHTAATASRHTSERTHATVLAAAMQGRRATVPSAAAPHARQKGVVQALAPQEPKQTAAQVHGEALAALRERAARHATVSIARPQASARTENPGQLATAAPALSPAGKEPEADSAADAHVQDRVHAWYQAQHAVVPGKSLAIADAPSEHPATPPANRKATPADFAQAAAVQREYSAIAHERSLQQTTAADDNADAESRIPGTAPTSREPAPFVHGSFGNGVPAANSLPAGSSQREAAPILRQPAPSAASAVSNIAPPQHVDLKHRGDGLSTAIAADRAAQAGNSPVVSIPVAVAADSSPRAIRALAQQVAASPTPALKLPAPPSGALRKALPAVAAVESGARQRELDPAVTSGMAARTFDDSTSQATARTAVALSAPSPIAGLVPARTRASSNASSDAPDGDLPAAIVSVNLFDRQGRLILVPPMKGSHEILVHQNQMAVADGLDRIRDDGDLLLLRRGKLLVALPDEDSTFPDDRLPANRRYARAWTVRFLRDLARAHYARFGTALVVTSAARTVEFQRRLVRVNGNAAPPTGDVASPHLYGQAIDIGKGHMSLTELTWMRAYLTPVENDGKIDVEEEFQQSCFHISVYRRYLGLPALPRTAPPAQGAPPMLMTAKQAPAPEATKPAEKKRHRISTAMLATGLR